MQPMLICFVQQLHPKSRGTVTLQSSNPYDPPLIDPNYLDDPQDVEDLVEGTFETYLYFLQSTDAVSFSKSRGT